MMGEKKKLFALPLAKASAASDEFGWTLDANGERTFMVPNLSARNEDRRDFIIRAVNAHDDLLAACESARDVLDGTPQGFHDDLPSCIEAYEKCLAAIAPAKAGAR